MSGINKLTPLTRVQPISKDRKKSSRQGNPEEQKNKKDDQSDSRERPGGSSHVDEYV